MNSTKNKSAFAKASVDKPIVILGGGPTGLAAAYRLVQKGEQVIILEKEKYHGGLSATLKSKDFLYEFGPHAFHLKNPVITSWLEDLIKKDFRIIPTDTQVLINGDYYNYPLRASELIRKINPILGIRIIFGYLLAYFKNIFKKGEYLNFEDWGLSNFGKTLYKISFGDYTEKVWGISPKKLSGKLASQKLSRLNLGDLIIKLIGFKGQDQPTYFKKYLYPESGMKVILDKIVSKIKPKGQIIYNAQVTKIKNDENSIREVEYRQDNNLKKIRPSFIISTLTLKDLVGLVNHPVAKNTRLAGEKLAYRDMIIVYMVSSQKNLPKSQWIYLVENKFKFNRVTFGRNLSPNFAPKNLNVLALEICCKKGDQIWQKSDKELTQMAIEDLLKLGFDKTKILHTFAKRIDNAYPIYLQDFEKNLDEVFGQLSQIDNLLSTGRNGFFLNSDIHDCFLMGFEAADAIFEKKLLNKNWYKKAEEKWLNL